MAVLLARVPWMVCYASGQRLVESHQVLHCYKNLVQQLVRVSYYGAVVSLCDRWMPCMPSHFIVNAHTIAYLGWVFAHLVFMDSILMGHHALSFSCTLDLLDDVSLLCSYSLA